MTETLLDQAQTAMQAAPEDPAARLRFYDCLSSTELHLLLDAEPQGDRITPRVIEADGMAMVLAFDRASRLADFVGGAAPVAVLSGRVLARMLSGQGMALMLNPGTDRAELLPPEALDWLANTLRDRPEETAARITRIAPPREIPETLLRALDAKFAAMTGLAKCAHLAHAETPEGVGLTLLAFTDALPGAEPALATAVQEVLAFSGLDAAMMDVAFVTEGDAQSMALERHGLRFDLPQAPVAEALPAPGSDPDKPPKLR